MQNRQQEWERKKAYLIRSLFEDIPPLSPIPEEDSISPSPSLPSSRPCSPLPPLIIETAPNPNRHDEPEEFYQELEIKMKRLHRKLFLNEDTISVNENMAELSRYFYDDFHYDEKDKDTTDQNNLTRDSSLDVNPLEETHSVGKPSNSVSEKAPENTTSTESSVACVKVTCIAEVHREDTNQHETESQIYKSSLSEESDSSSLQLIPQEEEVITVDRTTQEFDVTSNGNNSKSASEIINLDTASESEAFDETIEIMRQHNIRRHSLGSIRITGNNSNVSSPLELEVRHSRSLDQDFIAHDYSGPVNRMNETVIQLEASDEQRSSNNSKGDETSDIIYFKKCEVEQSRSDEIEVPPARYTSTPISRTSFSSKSKNSLSQELTSFSSSDQGSSDSIQISRDSTVRKSKGLKRRGENVKERKIKRKRRTSTSTQVSEETIDWDTLKHNLFVGTPKIFNLCSCKHHSCNEQ